MTVDHPSDANGRSNSGSPASDFWAHDAAGSASSSPSFPGAHRADGLTAANAVPRAAQGSAARSGGDEDTFAAGSAPVESPLGADGADGAPRKRRRGSRGGRRRRRNRPEDGAPAGAHDADPDVAAESDSDAVDPDAADEAGDVELAADDVSAGPRSAAPAEAARRAPARAAVHHEIDEFPIDGDGDIDAALARTDASGPDGAGGEKRRRRGRRGGRGRRRREHGAGEEGAAAPAGAAPAADLVHADNDLWVEEQRLERTAAEPAAPRSRAPAPARGDAQLAAQPGGKKKRRRRGSRGGKRRHETGDRPAEIEAIPGEADDDLPLRAPDEGEVELAPGALAPERPGSRGANKSDRGGRRRGKERRPALEDEDDDAPSAPEPLRDVQILVNASDPEEKRVAVVENGQIVDFQMTVRTENSVVNDIYRGRVVNLEPAIGAAFVDFGQGRNGFLHTSDVLSAYGDADWSLDKLLTTAIDPDEWDSNSGQPPVGAELGEEGGEASGPKKRGRSKERRAPRFRARPRLPITDLLKKGEMVVVQVTKDAIGDKGPTLTTYISIPGRYLVLMPSMARTGVSRKIEDEKERRRLKKILGQLEIPPDMGVIVRTAGVGRSKADLKRDLDYLKGAWETFSKRLKTGHGPAPLYQESDIAIRTVRDLFTPSTEAVIVDDPQVHQQIVDFTHQLMPEAVERVRLYTGPKPLFHSAGVEADFEKVFARRIELASGGSVVFDQAEALVAIDVNSGRTRTEGFDFEEIALKTNLEAVPEIARQIRLRDLGGIIVIDFIDMMKMSNIRSVERAFKDALEGDRARSKLGRISQFGLLELTRQRLGPGISKKVFTPCYRCRGTGRIRTIESRAAAILRRLGSAMTLKGFTTVEVRAHPEVVKYLREQCSEYVRALEYRFERGIRLFDVPEQVEDSVLRYLRADGREVRPGGRRKR